jgi:hypothetical protein
MPGISCGDTSILQLYGVERCSILLTLNDLTLGY